MNSVKIGLLAIFQIIFISFPIISNAATATSVSLPWSSSFGNTALSYQDDGSSRNVVDNLQVIEDHFSPLYLSTTANHPGGSGTMGYECRIGDGHNGPQSDSLGVYFASPQPELWIRYYIKYPTGFHWSAYDYHKWIYLGDGATMNSVVLESYLQDNLRNYAMTTNDSSVTSGGWKTYWAGGGTDSNGSWHCVEWHIKMDTNSANGISEVWVDGNLQPHSSNWNTMNYSGGNATARRGWVLFRFNTNQSVPSNTGILTNPYVAYDDIAVSNTGYIGPLAGGGGSDTTPPVISNGSPSGTLATGTTSTTMSVTTNEAATCKYGTSDLAYSSLPSTFSSTGSTSHSQAFSGLTNGSSYTYYVRCMDGSGNADTSSTAISFNVANTSVVNGACGTANGQSFTTLTSTSSNLCTTGTVASFSGSGPWTWGCNGSGGGTSTSSTACNASLATSSSANLLFSETWDSTNWVSADGWYDTTGATRATSSCYAGAGCFQCNWAQGGTNCTGGSPGRHSFTATNELYVKYYVKLSSNWVSSGHTYHPHVMFILSNQDDAYSGFYGTYQTLYIEENSRRARVGIQDSLYINSSSTPPWSESSCPSTETRAVAGCNGKCDSGSWDYTDCYYGGPWLNGRIAGGSGTQMSLNTWHKVEAYFKQNTIVGGISQRNGIMRLKVDDVVQFEVTDMQYITNSHSSLRWNQFAISPYIGDGSPVAQQMWIDSLEVYNGIPSGTSAPGSTSLTIQSVTK